MCGRRSARIEDFERRAKADPDAVHYDSELGRYLAVNPVADDTKLLQSLRVAASICTKVDYWQRADDVSFVQVESRSYSRERVLREECAVWILEHRRRGNGNSRDVARGAAGAKEIANRHIAEKDLSDVLQSI